MEKSLQKGQHTKCDKVTDWYYELAVVLPLDELQR